MATMKRLRGESRKIALTVILTAAVLQEEEEENKRKQARKRIEERYVSKVKPTKSAGSESSSSDCIDHTFSDHGQHRFGRGHSDHKRTGSHTGHSDHKWTGSHAVPSDHKWPMPHRGPSDHKWQFTKRVSVQRIITPSISGFRRRYSSIASASGLGKAGFPSLSSMGGLTTPRENKHTEIVCVVRRIVQRKQREQNIRLWSRAYRLIQLVVWISRVMVDRTYRSLMEYKTFLDIADMYSDRCQSHQRLTIWHTEVNPKDLGSSCPTAINRETRQILMMPPGYRTPQDVKNALNYLQCLSAFCAFPLSTQQLMAGQGSYTFIAPKRVIIRQGHTAACYYFILSGIAQVTKLRSSSTGLARFTESMLTQGHSFGQEAIVEGQPHQYSVISHKHLQLLSIPAELFYDVVKEYALDPTPTHVRYLKQQTWMKEWPIQQLLRHPTQTFMFYARDRQVIVVDSYHDDNLYVVKSGQCVVMMKVPMITTGAGGNKENQRCVASRASKGSLPPSPLARR
ncbi:hypothetical protein ACOMHN_002132 [Nucella lapillus]